MLAGLASVQAMLETLKRNKAMRRSRKPLEKLRKDYHLKDVKRKPVQFKKADPDYLKDLRIKLEKEAKSNSQKRNLFLITLIGLGMLIFYFIVFF
jgi:Flp pilus assembly protein TadB